MEDGEPRGWARLGLALRNRNIRRYLIGQSFSLTGHWMQATAEAWLILELTGSGTALGVHSLIRFGPVLVFGVHGGLLTDRMERLKLLKITQGLSALSAMALVAIVLSGNPSVIAVYAVGFFQGFVNAVDNPLRRGFIRDMSSDRELPNSVALNSTLATVYRTVGPALGGMTIAAFGTLWCFAANAVSYIAVFISLYGIDKSRLRPPQFAPPGRGQVRAVYSYAFSDPRIWTVLAAIALVGTFAWNYGVLVPVYATETLGGSASLYGFMLSVIGVGSFVGALVTARARGDHDRLLARSVVGVVLSMFGAAVAPTPEVAAAALFLLGAFGTSVVINAQTHLQLMASDQMSGRIMALFSIGFVGSKPLGGMIGGWLIDLSSPRLAFAVGGTVVAIGSLATRAWKVRNGAMAPAATDRV